MMLANGTLIGNRYRILELLGRGGMGEVYAAREESLERTVALKVLSGEKADDMLRRFALEARSIASLNSPYIVQIYEFAERNDPPFIAMEYVRGGDLAHYISAQPHLTLREFVDLARQLFAGLNVAHSADIIHRDIKPANILITSERILKLTDFGLVRSLSGGANLTDSNTTVGTVEYFPPEVAQGAPPGKYSDVYSATITLCELLIGRLPFDREENSLKLLSRIAQTEAPLPQTFRHDLPEGLRSWFAQAMCFDWHQRFQDASKALAGLLELCPELCSGPFIIPASDPDETKAYPLGARSAEEVHTEQKTTTHIIGARAQENIGAPLRQEDASEIIRLALQLEREGRDALDEEQLIRLAQEAQVAPQAVRSALIGFRQQKSIRANKNRLRKIAVLTMVFVLSVLGAAWYLSRPAKKISRHITAQKELRVTGNWCDTELYYDPSRHVLLLPSATAHRLDYQLSQGAEGVLKAQGKTSAYCALPQAGRLFLRAEGMPNSSNTEKQTAETASLLIADKLRLAALPFAGKADYSEATGDIIATRLAQTGCFQVVERVQTQRLLDNLKFEQSEYFDQSTTGKIGQMLGVEYLIQGAVQEANGVYRLSAQRVEAQTGKVLESFSCSGRNLFALQDALAQKMQQAIASTELNLQKRTPPPYRNDVAPGLNLAEEEEMSRP